MERFPFRLSFPKNSCDNQIRLYGWFKCTVYDVKETFSLVTTCWKISKVIGISNRRSVKIIFFISGTDYCDSDELSTGFKNASIQSSVRICQPCGLYVGITLTKPYMCALYNNVMSMYTLCTRISDTDHLGTHEVFDKSSFRMVSPLVWVVFRRTSIWY